jgi:hypothetical protein
MIGNMKAKLLKAGMPRDAGFYIGPLSAEGCKKAVMGVDAPP